MRHMSGVEAHDRDCRCAACALDEARRTTLPMPAYEDLATPCGSDSGSDGSGKVDPAGGIRPRRRERARRSRWDGCCRACGGADMVDAVDNDGRPYRGCARCTLVLHGGKP